MAAAYNSFETKNKLLETIPASNCMAVALSDSADLQFVSRGIFVGVGGNVAMTLQGSIGGASVVFKNVPSGTLLPLRASRVWSTGTTATDIVSVW